MNISPASASRCLLAVIASRRCSRLLRVASPALAVPKGEYAVFTSCPLSNPGVEGCLVGKTESGEFVIGTKKTKCRSKKPSRCKAAIEEEVAAEFRMPFVEAADGNKHCRKPRRPFPVGCSASNAKKSKVKAPTKKGRGNCVKNRQK